MKAKTEYCRLCGNAIGSHGVPCPTPEEIKQRRDAIKFGWTEQQLRQREPKPSDTLPRFGFRGTVVLTEQ